MAYIKAGSVRGATVSSKAVDYNHLATSINQTEHFHSYTTTNSLSLSFSGLYFTDTSTEDISFLGLTPSIAYNCYNKNVY